MDKVVRVKDTKGVVIPVLQQAVKREGKDLALAPDRNGAVEYFRTRADGGAARVVGTVVRQYVDVVQFAWIILCEEAVHKVADHGLLVSRGDEHCKTAARRTGGICLRPLQAEQ